jgi:hypothetical protein
VRNAIFVQNRNGMHPLKRTVAVVTCLSVGVLAFSLLRSRDTRDHDKIQRGVQSKEFARLDEWKARGWDANSVKDTIQRREVDEPHNFRIEWSLDGVSEAIRDTAKAAVPIGDNLDEHPGWADYYNTLADTFFLNEALDICGPNYSGQDDCYVSLNLVTEPHEGPAGPRSVLSYAAVFAADPPHVECRKYASCIARAFVGRELPPIPGGSHEPQGTVIQWGLEPWNDDRIQVNRAKLEACIAKATADLKFLREEGLPAEDMYLMDYMLGKFEDRLGYCGWRLGELG